MESGAFLAPSNDTQRPFFFFAFVAFMFFIAFIAFIARAAVGFGTGMLTVGGARLEIVNLTPN